MASRFYFLACTLLMIAFIGHTSTGKTWFQGAEFLILGLGCVAAIVTFLLE